MTCESAIARQAALPASRAPQAVAALLLTVFAWASAFPLIRVALGALAPLPLAAARFSIAGVVAAAWLAAARPRLPSLRDGALFLACGVIGIALYSAFLNSGQRTVSPGAASFLVNIVPIVTTLLATWFLRERFGAIAWAGSLVALAGVLIIASGQPGGIRFGGGASLVLIAAFFQASYFTLQRPLVPRYGALACTGYTFIAGALVLLPWLPAGADALRGAGLASPSTLALLALALLPSIVGYAAWTYGLGVLGAARAANFLYLVPPVATGISFALTGEVPRAGTIVGGLIAIAGVALVNFRSRLGWGAPRSPAAERAALEKALARASGTWGGFQASRPAR